MAILARGYRSVEIRRSLPGDPDDDAEPLPRSGGGGRGRACLYLPNGNPQPGPKFDYKLAWFERFIQHAAALYESGQPVVLAGDYNVVPTDFDIYNPRSWLKDALLQPRSARVLSAPAGAGLDRCDPPSASRRARLHVLGLLPQALGPQRRACASTICCSTPSWLLAWSMRGVDRWVRGQEHASDHAPTWAELR